MKKSKKQITISDEYIGTLRYALYQTTNIVKKEYEEGKNSIENYNKLKELSNIIYNKVIEKKEE